MRDNPDDRSWQTASYLDRGWRKKEQNEKGSLSGRKRLSALDSEHKDNFYFFVGKARQYGNPLSHIAMKPRNEKIRFLFSPVTRGTGSVEFRFGLGTLGDSVGLTSYEGRMGREL